MTLAADLVVTGSSENAFGLEAFGHHMLQRSGRHPGVSLRGGVEYEWLPGRLRVRGGSYWEPGRFVGVAGAFTSRSASRFACSVQSLGQAAPRPHHADRRHRVAYRNVGLSVGFWH